MVNCCGLLSAKKDPVPLKGIEVEVEVRDHVATVTSTLQYENKEASPIEAVFVFPLPGDAAVCHFSAKIGQTEVVAEVKEKQKAREEYDDALSSGQQAFLLEESEQSPDVFSLSVGSLPPGESASIRLEYVTELAVEADDGLRFCLPAVLNPRYQPQGSGGSGQPQVTSVPASLVPYSLSFSARVSSTRPVSKVESNCSLDPLQYLNTEQTQASVRLAAGHKFDRDVELLIYYKDAHQPTAVVEAGQESVKAGSLMGDPVVMLSLYPEFPKAVMSSVTSCGEFLFLMDRSGSMDCGTRHGQTRIGSARDTLLLLLKSLPMGCYFNIFGFGSNFDHIFPNSVEYKQDTMEEAVKMVETMKANMGGTEILQPLKHIYKQSCLPDHPRQLFVFTDGEVGNTKDVIDLVKKNAGSHRCFTFGIGEGASSALINGMSKQGGGHAQFITGTERMQPKVMQSLRFALQPAVVDISLKWDLPKGVSVTPLSPPITTLFQGQRSLIYAQLTGESSSASEGSVKVKYRLADQPFKYQLHFSLKPTEGTGLTVHRLGARTLIRSLELEQRDKRGQQDEAVKKKVVELSIQSGVSSAFTAFIAVNKGSGEAVQGPLLRRNVPVPMMYGFMASPQCGPGARMVTSVGLRCHAPKSRSKARISPKCDGGGGEGGGGGGLARCGKGGGLSFSRARCPGGGGGGGGGTSNMLDYVDCLAADPEPRPLQPPRDTLLQLISLQKASGSWTQTSTLENVLGKSKDQVEKSMPAQVNQEVWTTVLALIWLHGFKMEAQDEWQLLAMKAVSWVHAQKVPNLMECIEAGNTLLGSKVQKDALGL